MNNVIQMIDEAASYIRNHIDFTPQIAIILGSDSALLPVK